MDKLEQVIYRTSRAIYFDDIGIKMFFEEKDTNKNGVLEKDEIEKAYKNDNEDLKQNIQKEIENYKGNKAVVENLKHTAEIYKMCSESLAQKASELMKELNLGINTKITLEQLKEYYAKTAKKGIEGVGDKTQTKKIVQSFKDILEELFDKSADNIKKDCNEKFKGCDTFEKILNKRAGLSFCTAATFFDLLYYYMFYVEDRPSDEIGTFLNKTFNDPNSMLPTLKYFETICDRALNQLGEEEKEKKEENEEEYKEALLD